MKKTTTIIAIVGGLTLGNVLTAAAQTPAASGGSGFLNISVGGQFQEHDFSSVTTFELYDETGTVTANQTVGTGFVFDVTGGYRLGSSFAVAVGVSTFGGSGSPAALVAVPNPLFEGQPTLKELGPDDYGDLKQSNVAVNFQIAWMKAMTDRLDFSLFGGPSLIHVSQELASVTPDANATATIETQSKTTAKAGTVGVDLSYRMSDRAGIGGFVRYLGGVVDLDAVEDLQVGGLQAGGGIRFRF